MVLVDVVDECQEFEFMIWEDKVVSSFKECMEKLKEKLCGLFWEQGFEDKEIVFEEYFNMCYCGIELVFMIIKFMEEEVKEFGGKDWDFG